MGRELGNGLAQSMDANTKFLIDECLSPEMVGIVRNEFGYFGTHVTWLGTPPDGSKSWKDWDIVDRLQQDPHILVTNNRRDFVDHYFERKNLNPHEGLIVLIEKGDINLQTNLFRRVVAYIEQLDSTVNCLVEINNTGAIRMATWPDPSQRTPWADPFARK